MTHNGKYIPKVQDIAERPWLHFQSNYNPGKPDRDGSGSNSGTPTAPVQSAYNPMAAYLDYMARIEAEQRRAREEAYQKAASQQKKNYEYSTGLLNDQTNNALREAYINRMLSQRNLQQQLTAQGLNGGASETTTASLTNNYGNARNQLETERQRQQAALLNTYQNNMAQLEAQRASGAAASLSQFAPQLAKLAAQNVPASVNLTQMEGGGSQSSRSYLEYIRLLQELLQDQTA